MLAKHWSKEFPLAKFEFLAHVIMKNSEEIKSQVQNKTPFMDLRSVLDQATWSDFKNLSDSFSSSFGWGFLSCPALAVFV